RMSEVAQVDFVTQALKEDDEEISDSYNLGSRQVPKGVVVYEIAGSIFFGVVDKFKETLEQVADNPKILILRMREVHSIDATGIQMIEELLIRSKKQNTQLLLSGVHTQPVVALTRAGVMSMIGEENVLANIDAALNRAREILGIEMIEPSEMEESPSVSWEKNLDKPWLPNHANGSVAESTSEVIAEKVAEETESKETESKE
ncbi:MAG TPA: sodium-independent anion transporter, partial [Fibrobacteraceae bacterium]|nr:sodium-independent anion transporter [Fibrobacteraceae bacterium]